VGKTLKTVTHDQSDARPAVIFPTAERYRQLTATELYMLEEG